MPIFITILACTLLISQKNKSLKMLRMTGNKIGNKGAVQLAAMLQINSTLEELDISDCDLVSLLKHKIKLIYIWIKVLFFFTRQHKV